jgi:hypothetical protein
VVTFTGIDCNKLAVEKDRDSIFKTIWKPGFREGPEGVKWELGLIYF